MGRRSRKRYKKVVQVVRKPPTRFQCPTCGLMTLSISIDRSEDVAIISCSNQNCGLRATLRGIPKIYQEVDVYAKFLDKFTEGSIEVTYSRGSEHEVEG
ncbi:MAG: transcription elongation factor [Sulfolobales archaeon]|jgi:transcription elongation factor Elf1|nr:hypothetical protein [Desulfurococcaceae archaeon]